MFIYQGKITSGSYFHNESCWCIFPDDIQLGAPAYTVWQWTNDPQNRKNYNQFTLTTVDSFSITGSKRNIGFRHERWDIHFTADVSDDMKTLMVTLWTVSENIEYRSPATEFTRVYDDIGTKDLTVPQFYFGKMNFLPYASDEVFLVVAPGGIEQGKDICAMWQWTGLETHDKEPGFQAGKVEDVTKPDDWQQQIKFGGHFFDFEAHVDQDHDTLSIEVADKKSRRSSSSLTLKFQDLTATSSAVDHPITVAALWDTVTTATNDTDGLVACTIRNSDFSEFDEGMAKTGLVLGLTGMALVFAPVIAPKVAFAATIIGLFTTTIGYAAALGGQLHVWNKPGDAVSGLLFHNDSIVRKSSGGLLTSNNDVTAMRVVLEKGGTELVFYSYSKEKVGDVTIHLKELFESAAKTMLLPIRLPAPYQIRAYRVVNIPHIKPGPKVDFGKDVMNMTPEDILDAITIVDKHDGNQKWYGKVKDYLLHFWDQETMFEYSSDDSMQISESGGGSSLDVNRFEVMFVTPSAIKNSSDDPIMVVCFQDCFVDGGYKVRRRPCYTDGQVQDEIRQNPDFWAYEWKSKGPYVYCVKMIPTRYAPRVVYRYHSGITVFLKVKNWAPFQCLVPKQ